jgi:hypothetical protein
VYIQEKILDAYNKEAAQGSGTRSGGTVGRKRTESAQQALNTRKKPKSEESFSEPATSGGVDMSESKVAGKKFGPRQDEETPDEIDSKDIEL